MCNILHRLWCLDTWPPICRVFIKIKAVEPRVPARGLAGRPRLLGEGFWESVGHPKSLTRPLQFPEKPSLKAPIATDQATSVPKPHCSHDQLCTLSCFVRYLLWWKENSPLKVVIFNTVLSVREFINSRAGNLYPIYNGPTEKNECSRQTLNSELGEGTMAMQRVICS